jgi:hypothetical protein
MGAVAYRNDILGRKIKNNDYKKLEVLQPFIPAVAGCNA